MTAASNTHVARLLDTKLADVPNRIRSLAVLEAELEDVIERSHRLDRADCTDADVCHLLTR